MLCTNLFSLPSGEGAVIVETCCEWRTSDMKNNRHMPTVEFFGSTLADYEQFN